jgi:hypothetical protein
MPRQYSRITLRITDVRVERLQDISEADAEAEGTANGIHDWDCINGFFPDPAGYCVNGCGSRSSVESYQRLWESINGAHSWAANPWVFVISFERVENAKATEERAVMSSRVRA